MEKKFIKSLFSLPAIKCFSKLTVKYFYKRNHIFRGDAETGSLGRMNILIHKLFIEEISHFSENENNELITKCNCTDNKKYLKAFKCKISFILIHIKVLFTTFSVKIMEDHSLPVNCRRLVTTSYGMFTKCRNQFSGLFYSLMTCRELRRTCQELFTEYRLFLTGSPDQLTGSHNSFTENCMLNLTCPYQNIKCHIQYSEKRIVFRIFPVPYRINPERHGDFKKGLFF